MLPVDEESDEYRFYKTLNEDIQLKPNETNSKWDIQWDNGDLVNVTGNESLKNAICIAIMTRYEELNHNELYSGFGCRIHELIKSNKSSMTKFKIELFVKTVLDKMRRIKSVNWIEVTDSPHNNNFMYLISFSVTSISDDTIIGSVSL